MTLDDSENQQLKSYITRYLRQEEQNEIDSLRGGLYDDEYDDSYDEFTRMEVGAEGETLNSGKKVAGGRAQTQAPGLRMDAVEENSPSEESEEEEDKSTTPNAANTNGAERGGDSSRGRGRGGKGAGYPFSLCLLFFFLYLALPSLLPPPSPIPSPLSFDVM